MQSILITGVEKSGTTAVFAAMAARYSDDSVAFLEPAAADQPRVANVMRSAQFKSITKIVLKADICSDVIDSAEAIIATVRDPRDVVVSWLPFKAVSNPTLAGNTALIGELGRAFEQKARGDDNIDITHVEQIYQRHGVALPTLEAFAAAYTRLERLAETETCWIERFEDFSVSGQSSEHLPESLRFCLVSLSGDIAVNHRAGRSGEWKKWFSDRDIERFAKTLDPFIEQYGYPGWNLREAAAILRSEYGEYLERAVMAQATLATNARRWVSSFSKQNAPLFGTLKSQNAYEDKGFAMKLLERAAIGNLSAIKEVAGAVSAGFLPSSNFISRNAQSIDHLLSGRANG